MSADCSTHQQLLPVEVNNRICDSSYGVSFYQSSVILFKKWQKAEQNGKKKSLIINNVFILLNRHYMAYNIYIADTA